MWVPADRFVRLIDRHRPSLYQGKHGTATTRRMNELRSGRQRFVSLDVADRILTELDLTHLWHIPREDGGLADIYVDGNQYGAPERLRLVDGTRTNKKYATEAERMEARRRTYREAYLRRKERRAAA